MYPQSDRTELLRAAYGGDLDLCYNKQTRVIALEGPRGTILAYLGSRNAPDPERERYLTYYTERHTVYEGARVPAAAKADVSAYTFAVPHIADTRSGAVSGASGSFGGNDSLPAQGDWDFSVGGHGALDAGGVSVRQHSTEISAGSGGLSVTPDGVSVHGPLHLRGGTSKGLTAESPVYAIPAMKTIVTFFAGDWLPDVAKVARIAQFMVNLNSMLNLIGNLIAVLPGRDDPPARP